jgi:hypothetical protein
MGADETIFCLKANTEPNQTPWQAPWQGGILQGGKGNHCEVHAQDVALS